ncbi:unnamed protein product [Calicophoron daubneyi]|uniref:Serine aminopeptidase S33 domain-containing protein n=1 Tax=Calicophoron daubneyi TaxID=300641 RepID=A0AAV2TW61_CALDB
MSGILGEICQLFCCPPRPSHIVAKLAFLPPPPTYSITSSPNDPSCRIEFKPESGWQMSEDAVSKLTVFYTITKRQSRIVCIYIPANVFPPPLGCTTAKLTSNHPSRCGLSPNSLSIRSSQAKSASCPTLSEDCSTPVNANPSSTGDSDVNAPFTVLFSHGNAVDIGQMAGFLQSLACRFGVNILCYDYSGYGASSGQRLEENLYADAEAALRELRERYKVPLDRIVLYGQSIGTAPTIELATKYKVAGVVLHSAFMSGLRVVCPGTTRRFCFDPFTNIDKVSRIVSPTLVIHGTDDEIIGINHGRELYSRLPYPLEPAWIEGAGHNDIELFAEYATRLDRFFNQDLCGYPRKDAVTGTSIGESVSRVSTTPMVFSQNKFTMRRSYAKRLTGTRKSGGQLRNDGDLRETEHSPADSIPSVETTNRTPVNPSIGDAQSSTQITLTSSTSVDHDTTGTTTASTHRVWTARKDVKLSQSGAASESSSSDSASEDSSTPTGTSKHTYSPSDALPRPPHVPNECHVVEVSETTPPIETSERQVSRL